MIVPVMAISNLVLTQQIYSEEAEETNGAHAHYREPVPLLTNSLVKEFRVIPCKGNLTHNF